MNPRHSIPLFVASLSWSLACDPPSMRVGDVVDDESDRVSHARVAAAACEARRNCCEDAVEFDDFECEASMQELLADHARLAARVGLTRADACFPRLGECGPTLAEQATTCEPPCKLYVGDAGVGEPCDVLESTTWIDTCQQGLMCARTEGLHPGFDGRCEDPCATETHEAACTWGNQGVSCGPAGYCDSPIEFDAPGTCLARVALGERCDPRHDSCLSDAYCDASHPEGPTCVAVLADGEPCNGDRSCLSRRCGDDPSDPDHQVGVCEPTITDWCYEGGNPGDVLIPLFR